MSSRASTDSRHKKILRTRVKVWGKFLLRADETFNIDRAEQLIQSALDKKACVQTMLKLYGDGLKVGGKGVLAALHAEFIPYPSITAFISLRDAPNLLALCSKEGATCCVTVIQFKDTDALEVVCDIIDRQRGGTSKSGASSLPRSDFSSKPVASAAPAAAAIAAAPAAPTIVVSAAKPPTPVAVSVSPDVIAVPPPPPPEPKQEQTPPVEAADATDAFAAANGSSSNGGLFEKQPFAITQPPVTQVTAAVVHASTSSSSAAATAADDDDDNHFRTSIVFGEEIRAAWEPPAEALERQRRMETILELRAHGSGNGQVESATSQPYIDTVILNYDEIDTEGTHAVFDTPDGPPIQLNESTQNLRRRPNQLLVTANSSPASDSHGSSRLVVTSFSSGRSDSPGDGQVYMRAASSDSEPAYRTSTVIYRDEQLLDSPTERPRVTYVTNQRNSSGASAAPLSPQLHQQPIQLMRLVPVSSGRRRVVQQPQYFTMQPVSARENGVHLVAK